MPPKRKSFGEDGDGSAEVQMSQAQQRGAAQLQDLRENKTVESKLIHDVSRLILFKHTKREPILKSEISEAVGKEYRGTVQEHILRQVMSYFEVVFGFELREVVKGKQKVFILLRKPETHVGLPEGAAATVLEMPAADAAQTGLVAAVVSIILLHNGEAKADELWTRLRLLGIDEQDTDHPQFGNVKELFTQLKRQMYIVEEQREEQSGKVKVYKIGARAKAEVIESQLRLFLSSVFGKQIDEASFSTYQEILMEGNSLDAATAQAAA